MTNPHIPVLLSQTLEVFKNAPQDGLFIDCTVGYSGHSTALLREHSHWSHLGLDQDEIAIDFSTNALQECSNRSRLELVNFGDAILPPFIGLLADIGVSSLQLDNKDRGFCFDSESLDMRMNQNASFSAMDVVNGYTQEELTKIFFEYGEERMSKKFAELIVKERKKNKIQTSKQLAELISSNAPRGRIHPATLIFQAIRIEVNNELGQLQKLLSNIPKSAQNGAVVAIISFHSLEDRIVKNAMRDWTKDCICDSNVMRCECGNNHAKGKLLTKKPLEADESEIKLNPRSRSAKLRAFQFVV